MQRKLIIIAISLFFLSVVGFSKLTVASLPTIVYQPRPPEIIPHLSPEIVEAETIKPDIPGRMLIPAIGLDASINAVGLTSEQIVSTPDQEIGWYSGSVKAGEKGTAAFNGHVQDRHLHPGVFAKLADVKVGDEIIITDKKRQQFHYHVTKTELVNVKQFPIQEVYGQTEVSKISLVTCAGYFDTQTHDFTQRTIVIANSVN